MEQRFDDLPGWVFCISEVSAGVYRGVATRRDGVSAHVVGSEEATLLEELRTWARETNRSDG